MKRAVWYNESALSTFKVTQRARPASAWSRKGFVTANKSITTR